MFDMEGLFTELLKMYQHYQVRAEELDKEKKHAGKRIDLIKSEKDRARELILRELSMMLRYPPYHVVHKLKLDEFLEDGSFEDSVFIMTPLPDPKGEKKLDKELTAIIQTVRTAVEARGYKPRLASDKVYHPLLWFNVELHLLGCARGVAIVEDRYKKEFNPNVALEWGWMRAMSKPVLFLVEEKFNHGRADSLGFLDAKFNWSSPSSTIPNAVESWLPSRK